MKTRKTSSLLALLIAASLLISACSQAPAGTTTQSPAGTGTENGAAQPSSATQVTNPESEIDYLFIDMMVPHHQGAVEMAKIALERSQRPEIQDMANAIITGQEAEITQMKNWKMAWYGTDETPPMSAMPMLEAMEGMGGMGHPMDMQADVEALRNAQEPFDLAFIDAMIPHHQSALDAAQAVLETAVHPEIRELARQVIDAQQKEIDQMNSWRMEWFPDAPQPESSSDH